MKLIQTINTNTQAVPSQSLINIGRIDRKVDCGRKIFCTNQDSINIDCFGYYLVNVTLVVKNDDASAVTLALVSNNTIVESSKIVETYVGGDIKTLNLSKIVRLECGCPKFPTGKLKLQLVNLTENDIEVQKLNFSVIKVD